MSKQPTAPPPGDRPVPTAPPPPPGWRHWLWPAALLAMVVLFLILPAFHTSRPVSLTYSQFISDANARKIKDVTSGSSANGSNSTGTGPLNDAESLTAVIPAHPTTALSAHVAPDCVQRVPLA